MTSLNPLDPVYKAFSVASDCFTVTTHTIERQHKELIRRTQFIGTTPAEANATVADAAKQAVPRLDRTSKPEQTGPRSSHTRDDLRRSDADDRANPAHAYSACRRRGNRTTNACTHAIILPSVRRAPNKKRRTHQRHARPSTTRSYFKTSAACRSANPLASSWSTAQSCIR